VCGRPPAQCLRAFLLRERGRVRGWKGEGRRGAERQARWIFHDNLPDPIRAKIWHRYTRRSREDHAAHVILVGATPLPASLPPYLPTFLPLSFPSSLSFSPNLQHTNEPAIAHDPTVGKMTLSPSLPLSLSLSLSLTHSPTLSLSHSRSSSLPYMHEFIRAGADCLVMARWLVARRRGCGRRAKFGQRGRSAISSSQRPNSSGSQAKRPHTPLASPQSRYSTPSLRL
jgi:hypothetical protein